MQPDRDDFFEAEAEEDEEPDHGPRRISCIRHVWKVSEAYLTLVPFESALSSSRAITERQCFFLL